MEINEEQVINPLESYQITKLLLQYKSGQNYARTQSSTKDQTLGNNISRDAKGALLAFAAGFEIDILPIITKTAETLGINIAFESEVETQEVVAIKDEVEA